MTAWVVKVGPDACAGPEGGGGGQGVRTPPGKSHNIGFLSNTDPDPLKNQKATKPGLNFGPSPVRQRNAIYMAFPWRTDGGPL